MLALFLFLALRQARNVKSLFQYHLYGNDLKVNRFTGSLLATNSSLSGAFVLIIYYGFLYGPWVFPFVWVFWILTERTSAWTIDRTRATIERYGGWSKNRATLHQYIGLVFASPRARLYAGVLSLISYLGLISAEIVLAMHLLGYLFPRKLLVPHTNLEFGPFIVIVGIMLAILIYNVLSGFRGTVSTDFAQWIIISVMIAVLGIFVVAKRGVWWPQYPGLFSSPANGVVATLLNPDRQGYIPYISFLLSNIVFWGLWWPGAMDQWQRCAAAQTTEIPLDKKWGTAGAIPIFYFGVLSAVFVAAGVWLRVNLPNAAPSPEFLRTLVGNVQEWGVNSIGSIGGILLGAMAFWGLICAAMSTMDGYVMTASQTFFVDIANSKNGATLVDLSASDTNGNLLTRSRAYTIFIPFLVIALSILFTLASDVYALIYFSFAFMFALLPPLFAGLLGWGRPDARIACERSLLAGGISTIVGAVVIVLGLERALRLNDSVAIFGWYQAVYWWSTVVAVIGSLVLWLNWPKKAIQSGS